MDRKKIYISIITVCFLATAGVIYWGTRTPEIVVPDAGLTKTSGDSVTGGTTKLKAAKTPTFDEKTEFQTPRVFPSDSNLDLSVFDSPDFKKLTDYTPLTVSPEEIGKDNPFKP